MFNLCCCFYEKDKKENIHVFFMSFVTKKRLMLKLQWSCINMGFPRLEDPFNLFFLYEIIKNSVNHKKRK